MTWQVGFNGNVLRFGQNSRVLTGTLKHFAKIKCGGSHFQTAGIGACKQQ